MAPEHLRELLEGVRSGRHSVEEALRRLETLPLEVLEGATVDHHRHLRTGIPEVIFCQGKTVEQILAIVRAMKERGGPILGTRAQEGVHRALQEAGIEHRYFPQARLFWVETATHPPAQKVGLVAVVAAGTADLPVAEEAALTLEFLGSQVERIYDVGVAGIHRLLHNLSTLRQARVVIVVAGMEGALPSVVSGLVAAPVIGVPTSIGYGVHFGGLAPLLTMLNTCAPGLAVVNVDNGFGAAAIAHKINRLGEPCPE